MATNGTILNYINGRWQPATTDEFQDVINPATGETLIRTPLSGADVVDEAAKAAAAALPDWRSTPPGERIQHLFKLKQLLEENFDELARTITEECGKTLDESRGEMRRAIENVEVACGIPTMMQGDFLENIAEGIDELMIRQPVGVAAPSSAPSTSPA
jgi:malonate-semialdehyde dehydrogenase (acetylating) / methylmalonate-semialdehyde dehydrogenase